MDGAFLVTESALRDAGRDAFLGELVGGRYGIQRRLGVGGMGAVYAAFDIEAQKRVAVKFLREQYAKHPSIRARFIREAEAGASVDHPNIVGLFDFGVESDGTLWIAMEYVEGWTLRDEVNRNGPFSVKDIALVGQHVLRGLAAAHQAGLIHRDLKHDNIMFCGTRKRFTCRILDFGVVKSEAADDALANNPLTAAGVLVGSPSYMSPEQIRGLTVGPPADLYALGVVMYEAMTARRLFTVNNYEQLLRKGATREAPPLKKTAAGEVVPPALRRIMDMALAQDPAERFPDALTMLYALEQMDLDESAPVDLYADAPNTPVPLEADGGEVLLAEPEVPVEGAELTLAESTWRPVVVRALAPKPKRSVTAEMERGMTPPPQAPSTALHVGSFVGSGVAMWIATAMLLNY